METTMYFWWECQHSETFRQHVVKLSVQVLKIQTSQSRLYTMGSKDQLE